MAHHVTNINLRGRLTQIIILVIMILCGVLFSHFAEARHKPRFEKSKYKIDRPRYRITLHNHATKVCSILNKKRHSKQKNSAFFASNKSSKNNRSKGVAETD